MDINKLIYKIEIERIWDYKSVIYTLWIEYDWIKNSLYYQISYNNIVL